MIIGTIFVSTAHVYDHREALYVWRPIPMIIEFYKTTNGLD
jgi:hypothetical protein